MKNAFHLILFASLLFAVQSCDKIPGMQGEMKDDDASAKSALVGVWRGDGTYDDEEDAGWAESWKMVRKADGSYIVEYLIVHAGDKLYEQSGDAGAWGYENGVYFEINSQGEKILYDVFSVKKDWFEYNIVERAGSANIQESKTVDNFQLQNPPDGYAEVSYDQPQSEVTGNLPAEVVE